jgi:ubiquitin C-terminal hydrolase
MDNSSQFPNENKYIYTLFSVIVHCGDFGGGHYLCFIHNILNSSISSLSLNNIEGEWVCFDDTNVHRVPTESAVEGFFFFLFY